MTELDESQADARMAWHLVFTLGKRVEQLEAFLELGFRSGPLPEPDYEALGYPETNWRHTNIPFVTLVNLMTNLVGGPRIRNNETTSITVDDNLTEY